MKARIAGLIILAVMAGACLAASGVWAQMQLGGPSQQAIDRFYYLARYWMFAFIILATAWVVLLLRTIRYDPDEHAEDL